MIWLGAYQKRLEASQLWDFCKLDLMDFWTPFSSVIFLHISPSTHSPTNAQITAK